MTLVRATLGRRTIGDGSTIRLPGYPASAVTPGIVHIGLGGFHRAHFARYTHDLMEQDATALSWGIIGAGLRASDRPLLAALNAQEGLYTLVERDIHGETRSLIASIVRAIDASANSAELLDYIADPAISIVSITVSEHGYHLDSATRKLNLEDRAIERDIASPHTPTTLPGILVESFRRRRAAGDAPFTALSCDNIHDNGKVLRAAVLALAEQTDPDLATWIGERGSFPCSMVDRITPVASPEQIGAFQAETGSSDRAPIFAEAFRQWVIEDNFCDSRPPWENVGAQIVDDVSPYEKMKLRLLNASHLATAGLGRLHGYETVRQTIENPLIRRYTERLMASETAPTLDPVPGIDLGSYQRQLVERFGNPAIHDRLQRINADAPVNLLLDPLRDRLEANASIDLLSLGLAAWLRRVSIESALPLEGRPVGKSELHLQDRARAGAPPISFLAETEIFGVVGGQPRLLASVENWLSALASQGAEETLHTAASAGLF